MKKNEVNSIPPEILKDIKDIAEYERNKVYCKNCKYFGDISYLYSLTRYYRCNYNTQRNIIGVKAPCDCELYNEVFKCTFYKRKWWKFWK